MEDIPGRNLPLHPLCQHKSSEELSARRRRSAASRWTELLPSPEPALAHPTQNLPKTSEKDISRGILGKNTKLNHLCSFHIVSGEKQLNIKPETHPKF